MPWARTFKTGLGQVRILNGLTHGHALSLSSEREREVRRTAKHVPGISKQTATRTQVRNQILRCADVLSRPLYPRFFCWFCSSIVLFESHPFLLHSYALPVFSHFLLLHPFSFLLIPSALRLRPPPAQAKSPAGERVRPASRGRIPTPRACRGSVRRAAAGDQPRQVLLARAGWRWREEERREERNILSETRVMSMD